MGFGLFMSLDAFFIASLSPVYAGAVRVLFLLYHALDLRVESRRDEVVAVVGGSAVALAFFVQVFRLRS